MSASFQSAAAFLSRPKSSSSSPSTKTKLEIYSLYKYVIVSRRPNTPRPGLLDWTGRAKWDTWDHLAKELGSEENAEGKIRAEERYLKIAKELGWNENTTDSIQEPICTPEEEDIDLNQLDSDEEGGRTATGKGTGMGVAVSTMSSARPADSSEAGFALHEAIISSNDELLRTLLTHEGVDVNACDAYGYTPLHLAADRGNTEAVRMLILIGVQRDAKDPDGMTAEETAQELGHEEILKLLRS